MAVSAQAPHDVMVILVPEATMALRKHVMPGERFLRSAVPAQRSSFRWLRLQREIQDYENDVHLSLPCACERATSYRPAHHHDALAQSRITALRQDALGNKKDRGRRPQGTYRLFQEESESSSFPCMPWYQLHGHAEATLRVHNYFKYFFFFSFSGK
jgi:hypothetical protein